jgi:hypothetical protein
LPNSERAEALRLFLPNLGLVVLPFPAFTDGRAFSLARQIRGLGYACELRASGAFLPDQLGFLTEVGFDSFEVSDRFPESAWTRAAGAISLSYQTIPGRAQIWLRPPPRTRRRARTQALRLRSAMIEYGHLIHRFGHLDGEALLAPCCATCSPAGSAVVSSFGAESAVLLHMAAGIDRSVPVIFLETGKLFPETLAYRDRLVSHLGLENVRSVTPDARRSKSAIRTVICTRPTPTPAATCARSPRSSARSPYILKMPKRVSGTGALRQAENARPSTSRVSSGAITPSSHSRAVA